MEINTIGNNGYAAKGLDGISGDSGKTTHFSAYDLSDSKDRETAKKLIILGKALSTNPDLQAPEVYKEGDMILTVYGEFYALKSISLSDVEISPIIADFFPTQNEELEDDGLTFEFLTGLREAGSEPTYYNTFRPSTEYYSHHNASPLKKVRKNVGIPGVPNMWGNYIKFSPSSVQALTKILTDPEYEPYVKISLIFRCGLTKEIIYTKPDEVLNTVFIENEYIHMCGYMTCEGDRYVVALNNEYLQSTKDAEPYYNELSKLDASIGYTLQNYADNGNNRSGSNYTFPLIFGNDIENNTIRPERRMCEAFVEYYKNGKLKIKKINLRVQ